MPFFRSGNYVLKSTQKRRFTKDYMNKNKSSKRLKLKALIGGRAPIETKRRISAIKHSQAFTKNPLSLPKKTKTRSNRYSSALTRRKSSARSESVSNLKHYYNHIDVNIFKNLFSNIININGFLLAFQNNEVEYLKKINKSVNQKTFLPVLKNTIIFNFNTEKKNISVKKLSNIIDISFELIKKFVLKNKRSSQKGGANPQIDLEKFIEAPVPALELGQRQGGLLNFFRNMIDYLEDEGNDAQIIKAKAEFYEDNFKKYVKQVKEYNELSRKFRLELEDINTKKIEDLDNEIVVLKDRIGDLDDANNKNLGLIENLKDGQAINEAEIKKLKGNLSKKSDEIRNLKGELNDQNSKLNQCEIEGKNKAKQIENLKNANNDLNKELIGVKGVIKENNDLIAELNKEKELLQNQLDNKSAKSAENIKQLEKGKDELKGKIQNLILENNNHKSQLDKLLKKIAEQSKAITRLEKQLVDLDRTKAKLEGKNIDLEERLNNKDKEKYEIEDKLNKQLEDKQAIIDALKEDLHIEGNKNKKNLNNIKELRAKLLEAVHERDKLKNNSNTAHIRHVNETLGGLTETPLSGKNNTKNITGFVTQRISYDNAKSTPQISGQQNSDVLSSPLATLVVVGVVSIIGVLGYNYLNNITNNKDKQLLEIKADLKEKEKELESNKVDKRKLHEEINELREIKTKQEEYQRKVEQDRKQNAEFRKTIVQMRKKHKKLVQDVRDLDDEINFHQQKENTLHGRIEATKKFAKSLKFVGKRNDDKITHRKIETQDIREDLDTELYHLTQNLELLKNADSLVFRIDRLYEGREESIQDGFVPCVNAIQEEEIFNQRVKDFLEEGQKDAKNIEEDILEQIKSLITESKKYKEKILLLEREQKIYEANIEAEILRKDSYYRDLDESMEAIIIEANERFIKQTHTEKAELIASTDLQVDVLLSLLNGQGVGIKEGDEGIIKELLGNNKYKEYIKELQEIRDNASNAVDVSNVSISISIDLTKIIKELVNDFMKLSRDNLLNAQHTHELFELFSEDLNLTLKHPLLNNVSGQNRRSSSESIQQSDKPSGNNGNSSNSNDNTMANANNPSVITGEKFEPPPNPLGSELGFIIGEAQGKTFQRCNYTLARLGWGSTETREEFKKRAEKARNLAKKRENYQVKKNTKKK